MKNKTNEAICLGLNVKLSPRGLNSASPGNRYQLNLLYQRRQGKGALQGFQKLQKKIFQLVKKKGLITT